MYGHIHVILKDLVISEFGEEQWKMVLHASGCADLDVLDSVPYPDAVTFSLITSLCMISAWSPEEAVEKLGHHLIVFSLRSGPRARGRPEQNGTNNKPRFHEVCCHHDTCTAQTRLPCSAQKGILSVVSVGRIGSMWK
ncbi:unnamed protein product [Durusdinium trenchii]|uniref:Heme NO-binding domain-containing protein n=1 Tax=Durusdinium trenchii TaxID=1381693 RepID=A0ABP0QK57_9DINO